MEPTKIMLPRVGVLREADGFEGVEELEESDGEEAIMARAQAWETRKEPVRLTSRRVRKREAG